MTGEIVVRSCDLCAFEVASVDPKPMNDHFAEMHGIEYVQRAGLAPA